MAQVLPDKDDDDDVCEYNFPGEGRLVLNTIHGQFYIDVSFDRVNVFSFNDGKKRVDHVVLGKIC